MPKNLSKKLPIIVSMKISEGTVVGIDKERTHLRRGDKISKKLLIKLPMELLGKFLEKISQ